MIFYVLTLFPSFFTSSLSESILARAQKNKIIKINIINLRDYSMNKHKTCDDFPFGGGPGMVLKPEPIFKAVDKIIHKFTKNQRNKTLIISLSAKGNTFSQAKARQWAKIFEKIIIICGHYEGIDERVNQFLADKEISIGNYILTGGEIPALVIIDAITRLIPGVIGNQQSLNEESFSCKSIREYPQYTRPANFRGLKVPKVLLSGNHQKIKLWKQKNQK